MRSFGTGQACIMTRIVTSSRQAFEPPPRSNVHVRYKILVFYIVLLLLVLHYYMLRLLL